MKIVDKIFRKLLRIGWPSYCNTDPISVGEASVISVERVVVEKKSKCCFC